MGFEEYVNYFIELFNIFHQHALSSIFGSQTLGWNQEHARYQYIHELEYIIWFCSIWKVSLPCIFSTNMIWRMIQCWAWYHLFLITNHISMILYKDFNFFIPVGYGYLMVFQYHMGIYTIQEPSYLARIALASIWFRTVLT